MVWRSKFHHDPPRNSSSFSRYWCIQHQYLSYTFKLGPCEEYHTVKTSSPACVWYMKRKPWLCRSICPRRSSPYSSSFSHYVGICDSSAFITTHVQLTSSINISFFLKHMKAHMTPIDASQQHCPEYTVISHACPPIIVRYGLRILHIILFTTCTKVTKMAIHREDGSTRIHRWPERMQHDRITLSTL